VTDKVDPDFMLHCIYHDTAEISTGDIPYPVKSLNGDLKDQMDKLEKESIARQAGYWDPVIGKNLSGEQRQLFKLIELIEMAEWGIEEVLRGSQYGEIVADRCLKAVYTQMQAVNPLPLSWERLACYIQKRIERLSLDGTEDWWIPDKWNLKEIKDV
jgi:5'-deoxynucleotidase YfbR-like HD superfamily hydrolase